MRSPLPLPVPLAPLAALVILLALGALGCASGPFARPPSSASSADSRIVGQGADYVIGIPDLLELTVWQQEDLSGPLLVRRDGKVSVPLVGDLPAAGLTPAQLAEKIRAGLGAFVANPRVDVAVTEMRSQVASVIGEGVLRSGPVDLQRNLRVVDAIAEMGGFSAFAKKDRIRILRNGPDGQVEYRFDYEAFVKGRNPESNILLAPGDTVIVPE